jgi:hypothetical protein
MADWGKYILSRLFIAVPELQIDQALLLLLKREGLVTQADIDMAKNVRAKNKKYGEIAHSMRGKTLVERLMLVVPEVMSATTIDALRRWDLISPTLGNALRVGLRGGKAIIPGDLKEKTALERWSAGGKAFLSFDTINLLRDLDNSRIAFLKSQLPDLPENASAIRELLRISVVRGNILRSILSTGRLSADTIAAAANANNAWGILTVVFEGIFSDRLLRDAIRVGAISQERFELISALSKLGLNIWKKGIKTIEYNSIEARFLMMSEGILSPEMITALRAAGLISPELAQILYPAASGIRAITRGRLADHMKGIRVRVVPGEAPIKSFARITGRTDREILKLLAQAAEESRKEAARLMKLPKFGRMTRAAQQKLIEDALHKQMRAVWEGVGHLTIFGEKESARAALASMDFLHDHLWSGTGKAGADFRRTIIREANTGIDAYISRAENINPFSRRIYKNHVLARDLVSRRVNINLLRGLSAKEFADDVSGLIRPGVRGGVTHAAMRLARTEINNAFHFSSIRYTREMPWVEGYRWNLSGSHPHLDICNTMAQTNHDNIGRGVYKKSNVPGKPHPHCLCYVTTVTASNATFERQLKNGSYDKYLHQVEKQGTMGESEPWHTAYDQQAKELAALGGTALGISAAKSIGPVAIGQAISLLFN